MTAAISDTVGAPASPVRRRWLAFGVLAVAAAMTLLDVTIVNVAIPSIQRNLGATYGQVQLVIALYGLGYAVVLITGARLGDIFGRRRLFVIGVVAFTAASALCGLAQSPALLIAARVVQGIGGGLMFPQVLSMTQIMFAGKERTNALGFLGATIGLASVGGPIIGGLLIESNLFDLDWRPIFLVNVPIGIAILIAVVLVPESRAERAERLDLVGVGIVSLGLLLLVYPLIQGREAGWPLWAFLALGASVPVLVGFVLFERWKTSRHDAPLLDLSLFGNRSFVAGLVIFLMLFVGLGSLALSLTLYLQIGFDFTALQAGLTTLPIAAAAAAASAASSKLAPRIGRTILALGAALMAAGLVAMMVTIDLVGPDMQGSHLIPALAVFGLGLGFSIAPVLDIILIGVPERAAGSASGTLSTVEQVGGAAGIAVIGVILFGLLSANADASSDTVTPSLESRLAAAQVSPGAIAAISAGFRECFLDRSNASDPTEEPESCRAARAEQSSDSSADGLAISAAVDEAATEALSLNFADAMLKSLFFNLATCTLILVLVPLLPRAKRVGSVGHTDDATVEESANRADPGISRGSAAKDGD